MSEKDKANKDLKEQIDKLNELKKYSEYDKHTLTIKEIDKLINLFQMGEALGNTIDRIDNLLSKLPFIRSRAYRFSLKFGQRGPFCLECGSREHLHFHHENYADLEGFTLCAKCHKMIHSLIKKKEEEDAKRKRGDDTKSSTSN